MHHHAQSLVEMGSPELFAWAILELQLSSTSLVGRISDVSHQAWPKSLFLKIKVEGAGEKRGEMTQTLHAYMNKRKINK
jgi:hypothetical protein